MTAVKGPEAGLSRIVRERRSARDYESVPVALEVIEAALLDAGYAPSNCNTQPWQVHIVSGRTRERLSDALLEERDRGGESYDFTFDTGDYPDRFEPWIKDNGQRIYEPQGIARGDKEGRRRAASRNLTFYDAPHVALIFMPSVGDSVRVAADVGMFLQTFLLSLTARGVASIAQTSIARHAEAVRNVLGVGEEQLLLCGVSFGYPVLESPVNQGDSPRAAVADFTVFHD